ncbi:FAD-dependent monooxygenase [Agromyces larvae]|uniref:FAD-dependent monooxygenase n=1 Tax=Agromyces larvae TaxID=2929802 RepID=A0ABY4BX27_9MICO|nr:FAD-dependent monooxygenase [Agromyces larvae]UOE43684.1 FAD-dependent monooxygenase [Agromyces larvae]
MKVLISGASIAGPAVAFWLSRSGHDVTVVEQAPALRAGGQAVDFKGATHRRVLERMGLWDAIHDLRTPAVDAHFVDATGRTNAVMPHTFSGGDVEIARGDLAHLMYEHTADRVEYVFGDRIERMHEHADGIDVEFRSGRTGRFDLVVGADGVHSGVRRLAFGPEQQFVKYLGYSYAVVGGAKAAAEASDRPAGDAPGAPDAPGVPTQPGLWYNEPGRLAVIGGPKAPDFFVFASDDPGALRHDVDAQKRLIADAYAGAGWRVPEMLERLATADEFYLDGLNRVHLDRFTSGRVVLVGDAGYANTLGGFGTGLSIVGAYVLAGELAAAGGDHRVAFANYDERMLRYSKVARSGNAGPFLAPPSRWRIAMRDLTFKNRLMLAGMMKLTDMFANDIALPEYREVAASGAVR